MAFEMCLYHGMCTCKIIVYTHGYMFAYGKTGSLKIFSYWCQQVEVATIKFGQGNHVCVEACLIFIFYMLEMKTMRNRKMWIYNYKIVWLS